VAGGARWVLLREKDLPRAERLALAGELRRILAPVGGRLIVAGPDPLGGDAVHLSAADPPPPSTPPTAPHDALIMDYSRRHAGDTPKENHDQRGRGLVGRSCHDADEVRRLTIEDYLTVSPVFASASKPGYGPPLGADGLATLCRLTDRPVLALGGVETPQRAAASVAAGAVGVAVMGAVMRSPDPAAVVAELSAAVAGAVVNGPTR
jgi:thiamine-phosphate pyrophosphorylase